MAKGVKEYTILLEKNCVYIIQYHWYGIYNNIVIDKLK